MTIAQVIDDNYHSGMVKLNNIGIMWKHQLMES